MAKHDKLSNQWAPDSTVIAVVEDNLDVLDDVVFHLECAAYRVLPCRNATELDRCFALDPPDRPAVIVLDIGLPGENGLSIAARMRRAHPALGIVMLTARGRVEDRILGHEMGADNYLPKPVDMKELVAVVGARIRAITPPLMEPSADAWQLYPLGLQLVAPDGIALSLTGSEWTVMRCLALAAEHTASRQALIEALGQSVDTYDDRRLEALISRLRRKLKLFESGETVLRGIRNVGYAFGAPLRLG